MGMVRRSALAAFGVFAAAGCTLLVSTSDLAKGGPTSDGGSSDGGADAVVEASIEPAEAGEAGVDAGGAFCAALSPAPAYCNDFDDGPFKLAAGGKLIVDPQGSLTVDHNRALSGEGALLTAVTKGTAEFPRSYIFQALENVSQIRIEADVFMERIEVTSGACRLLGVQAGADDSTVVMIGLFADGNVSVTEEWREGSVKMHNDRPKRPVAVVDQWFHATVNIDLTSRSLSAKVNGQEISNGTPLTGPILTGPPAGIFGLYYPVANDQGWSARYDNVVIDGH